MRGLDKIILWHIMIEIIIFFNPVKVINCIGLRGISTDRQLFNPFDTSAGDDILNVIT
jgi:hypothetical protein